MTPRSKTTCVTCRYFMCDFAEKNPICLKPLNTKLYDPVFDRHTEINGLPCAEARSKHRAEHNQGNAFFPERECPAWEEK